MNFRYLWYTKENVKNLIFKTVDRKKDFCLSSYLSVMHIICSWKDYHKHPILSLDKTHFRCAFSIDWGPNEWRCLTVALGITNHSALLICVACSVWGIITGINWIQLNFKHLFASSAGRFSKRGNANGFLVSQFYGKPFSLLLTFV